MPNIEWLALYMALGALVGFLAGLLGAGGGGILVPVLASIFTYQGMDTENVVHLALGTALTCMIVSSTASTRAHASRGTVEWRIVREMAPGIILGAFLVSQVAANFHPAVISLLFSLFMAFVAWRYFFDWQPKSSLTPITFAGLAGVGVGIGTVSALVAAGGGFLTIAYLSHKNIDIKRAVGTSAAIGLPVALSGAVGYLIGGWNRTVSEPYTLGFIYLPHSRQYRSPVPLPRPMAHVSPGPA